MSSPGVQIIFTPRRLIPFGVGIAGAAIAAALCLTDPLLVAGSWLWSFMFWLSIPLGCVAISFIHVLTGGGWGDAVGQSAVAAVRTLIWSPLAFAPVALSLRALYPWAASESPHTHQAQATWLNESSVLIRAGVYFAVWIASTALLSRDWNRRTQGARATWRHPRSAAVFLILFWLTATFAAVDWMMSLELDWHSSIYGAQFGIGTILAALAFLIIQRWRADDVSPPIDHLLALPGEQETSIPGITFKPTERSQLSGDLGNLLLAAVMVWMYFAFSQFLIVWSGNLPHEAQWYLRRSTGIWLAITIALVAAGFAIPFAALICREIKTAPRRLAAVAGLVLATRAAETFWLVAPALPGRTSVMNLSDLACLAALGGLWLGLFELSYSRTPDLPPSALPVYEGSPPSLPASNVEEDRLGHPA